MKLDINKLNEAVEKAFDRIFEEEERKEVNNTKPTQWHDDYSNKEEKNVVQTRINPDTKKPEFKIPTNDKVYDTRDAAIAALRESKKKTITINENDIRNMVMEALNELNFTADKLAQMAGKAQGLKKTGLSAIGNKNYNARKERQRQIFGNMAANAYGSADAPDKRHDVDNYRQQFNSNGKDGNDFQIQRWQWNNLPNNEIGINPGAQHNQTMTTGDYYQNVMKPMRQQNGGVENWGDKQWQQYDKVGDVRANASRNQAMYRNAMKNTQNGEDAYDRSWTGRGDDSPVVNSANSFNGYSDALNTYRRNMREAIEETVRRVLSEYMK